MTYFVGKVVAKCEYKFVLPIWRAFGNNHKNYNCIKPFSQQFHLWEFTRKLAFL